ncbi:DUF4956 domain-containing protein [Streptomyces iconiensis]|uniref:DUF4956 domain-containing protein n=1 Tax=Streptomyces iconiensis TaxID=1384038 RepID=A0ABT7A059_9ACTN|nr:DUF4956 domain-containing protein [Streptomyces iconiensis]MDJ1134704.1 DUF4956 domain-containing protein [Streptomyces iconiensis]
MDSLSQFLAHLALDLAAVTVLTFVVYFPRHRRRDLLPAYLALNVALFAVVAALARVGGSGGMALGFGLFGVLSMIRLRSESIQNEEVAYYFTTLVIGLVAGLPHLPFGLAAALCALPVAVLYGADHPRLFARTRRAVVTLDVAVTEPDAVRERVRARLGEPLAWSITEVDYVRDLTVLDVRYREAGPAHPESRGRRVRRGHQDQQVKPRDQERSASPVRSTDSDSTPPTHTAAHMRETAR